MKAPAFHVLFDAARSRDLAAGEGLFHAGDAVQYAVLVKSGMVHLQRQTGAGVMVLLQRAGAGVMVSEASVYSAHYHCDCRAVQISTVCLLPMAAFKAGLAAEPALMDAWAAHLAHSVQRARMRAEIRSLRSVADRLDTWLADGGQLPTKGHWQDLAAELGITREALYRELARRANI